MLWFALLCHYQCNLCVCVCVCLCACERVSERETCHASIKPCEHASCSLLIRSDRWEDFCCRRDREGEGPVILCEDDSIPSLTHTHIYTLRHTQQTRAQWVQCRQTRTSKLWLSKGKLKAILLPIGDLILMLSLCDRYLSQKLKEELQHLEIQLFQWPIAANSK